MAFRLADIRKTVRARSDGQRYLHPKLLDAATVSAQVALALAYMRSRLGRSRREVDPDVLVRFFGDPKIARGLVACLGGSYRWHALTFADVLDGRDVARLAARGITTPSELRLFLYDAANRHGNGYVGADRAEQLQRLTHRLRLSVEKLDQLVALDAEENAVLVRTGPVPSPEDVVALYNFNVIDAVLRNSSTITLDNVSPDARARLEESCAAHGISCTWAGGSVTLHNRPDPFGSYARGGLRMARALYAAAAAEPAILTRGRACVSGPGKAAVYAFRADTLAALTGGRRAIYYATAPAEFREEWSRYRAQHGTFGWRLAGAPEPLLSPAGLILAPFALLRDDTRVLLWPTNPAGDRDTLAALHAAGVDVLAVVPDALPAGIVCARASDGAGGIVAALNAKWTGGRVPVETQALESLLGEVETQGFIPEDAVLAALGCAEREELPARLRMLDPARALYVPGIGLCSRGFAEGMRKGLRRRTRRPAA